MTDLPQVLPALKALGDGTRLKILDVLSCGEVCACQVLESLSISQPTLSHHMKVLTACGLVSARRDATWMYYSFNKEKFREVFACLDALTSPKEGCVCLAGRENCGPRREKTEQNQRERGKGHE